MDAAPARTADRRNSSWDRSWIDHLAADSLILLGVVIPLPLFHFFHGFPAYTPRRFPFRLKEEEEGRRIDSLRTSETVCAPQPKAFFRSIPPQTARITQYISL